MDEVSANEEAWLAAMPPEAARRVRELDGQGPGGPYCRDCGIEAWGFEEDGHEVQEDFYVSNQLWDAVCPDDDVIRWEEAGVQFGQGQFVLCIGCFEHRLGRTLTADDLGADGEPPEILGTAPSSRYSDRWRAANSGPVR